MTATAKDKAGNVNTESRSYTVSKANATCTISGYTGVYDAASHGASGSCSGVGGESAGTLDYGTTFKDVSGGTAHWVFTGNGNYDNESGDMAIVISKADATCTVVGYSEIYDGAAHGATGSCIGVLAEPLAGLDLGATFTNVPGGTADWAFTDVSGNYDDESGDVAIVISKADALVTVNGYTGIYDAVAHGATGTATGVGGVNLSAGLNLGATFTNVPGGTALWTFAGGTNYLDENGSVTIGILPWTFGGFYQPVDNGNVWNTVKGGSTVPLKFEIFAGPTELTDVSAVKFYTAKTIPCTGLPGASEDQIETLSATGSTVLRYADGKFIFNWKTPKAVGCYQVTITAQDGSTLVAYFKLK